MECPRRGRPLSGVPGGGGHCLGHGNPVSAVVVDTGSLVFSQSHQSEERNTLNHVPFTRRA